MKTSGLWIELTRAATMAGIVVAQTTQKSEPDETEALNSTNPWIALAMLVCVMAFAGCQRSQSPETNSGKATEVTSVTLTDAQSKAIAAKDELFARLSGRLTKVMKAEGPAAAIEVCRREASEIARTVGEEYGLIIGRTSTRLRNPQNGPPEWVNPLIVEPKAEPHFVELPNGHTGALLPIILQAKCLTCHGSSDTIADGVKSQLAKLYPDDQATGFKEGDLRGWFWVDVPADGQLEDSISHDSTSGPAGEDHNLQGHGPGMGRGRGMMGRGPGPEMREDMTTLHAMFDSRDKIRRTVKNLPDGAEAITESDNKQITALIQKHVPAMETRVHEDKPLPPMTFHPIFVELIKHADDYTLTYEDTDKGMKVTYKADDPFVIMLVQEHAKLVSRFIKNGMEEIHKPYTLPAIDKPSADDAPSSD